MDIVSAAVLFILIVLSLVMTWFAFNRRNLPLSFLAALAWLSLLIYTRNNPLPNMDTGSYGDEIILWICILMMPLLLYNGYIKHKEDKSGSGKNSKRVIYYNQAGDYVGRHEISDVMPNHRETAGEYRERLHNRIMLARQNRKRYS
jgi:hypothetical protein